MGALYPRFASGAWWRPTGPLAIKTDDEPPRQEVAPEAGRIVHEPVETDVADPRSDEGRYPGWGTPAAPPKEHQGQLPPVQGEDNPLPIVEPASVCQPVHHMIEINQHAARARCHRTAPPGSRPGQGNYRQSSECVPVWISHQCQSITVAGIGRG